MGMPTTRPPGTTPRAVLELLAYDDANPSSIVGALARPGENARGAREAHLGGDVGVPQHDLPRAAAPGGGGPRVRPGAVLLLRPRAGRDARRLRRRDDEPRRRLALPRARPQPRAGRHDRPAAGRPRRHAVRGDDGWITTLRAARPTRPTCAPTSAASSRGWCWSSCCSTGCSRARCSTRSVVGEEALARLDPTAERSRVGRRRRAG